MRKGQHVEITGGMPALVGATGVIVGSELVGHTKMYRVHLDKRVNPNEALSEDDLWDPSFLKVLRR